MILPKSNRTTQLAWLWFLLFGFAGTGYGAVRWDVVTSPTEVINTGRSEVTGAVVLSVRGTGNVTGTSSGGPARIALIYSSPALQIDNTLPTIRLGRSPGFAAANPTIASIENRIINGRCIGFIIINLLPGVKLAEKEFIRIHSMRARIDTSLAITPSTDLFVDLQSIDDPAAHSFSPERALVAKSFDAMNVNITSDAILLCYPTTGKAPAGTAIPSYNIRIAEGFARAFVDRDSNNDNNASNDRREEEGPALAAPTNSTQFLVWLEGIPTSVSGIIWPPSSGRDPRTNAQLILLDSGFNPSAGTSFGIYSFESLNQVGLSDLAVETFTLAPLIVLRSGVTTTGSILAAVALAPGVSAASGCAAPSESASRPRFQLMLESDEIATNNPKDDPPRPYAIISTCSPPTIITQSVPNGTVGVAYSAPPFEATGGKTPYSWSISAGALPAGLTLSSTTGVITGTPTAAGPFNFTVRVTDNTTPSPQTATRSYSGTISTIDGPSVSGSIPNGTVGVPYSVTLVGSGGTAPYTFSISAGALPAGLTLNSTGVIAGTPTTAGSFNFTVRVTDSTLPAPQTGTGSFSVMISPSLTITTESVPNGTVGVAYSAPPFEATGGKTPYSWSISAGALPAGLTLNSTGVITGTPSAAGPFNFTVRVTDSTTPSPQMATRSYSGMISPSLTITTQSVPNGTVRIAYSALFEATGGKTPYTWSISAGSLPAGLTQNSATGAITGTPSAAGPFNFTVRVTDSTTPASQTVTRSYSGTISDVLIPPTITTESVPNGTVGVVYSAALAASGGTAPYTWSISAGALPAGLAQNPTTGAITGTPSAAGPFNFSVRVTDSATPSPQTVTRSYSGTISDVLIPPTITTESVPNGTVGVVYSAAFAATGGTAPYTWSISAGALPAGLAQNPTTGAITGTPSAAGPFNFSVRVTDSATPSPQTVTRSYSGTISDVLIPPTITTESVPNGTVGVVYSAPFAATGGTAPYTWSISAGSLPAGLMQNSATGAITGTPSAAGPFNFTVRVTDSTTLAPQMASQSYGGTISDVISPPTITTESVPNGTVGAVYSAAFAATGGTAPYTWSISAGSLPAGLTQNSATGAITGTPTAAGSFNFTVRVTDSTTPAPQMASRSYSGMISPSALTITTESVPNGAVGVAYSAVFAAAGGTAPYTWSITAGALLAGVTQNATTGAIAGTPTTAGAFSFTVKVTDNTTPTPQMASRAYSGSIGPARNPIERPSISGLSPSSIEAGSSGFELTVNGSNFVKNSVAESRVRFNNQERPTTFLSSAQLRVRISERDVASGGAVNITVANTPGGAASNIQTFAITTPPPSICCFDPISAIAGSGPFNVIVYGSSFVPTSVVQWNGSNRNTTFIDHRTLTAAITEADIATVGTASVRVFNPSPGGGPSDARTLEIRALVPGAPTINRINPTRVDAGGGDFTLTVNGTGFVPASMVQFNGEDKRTFFDNATQLRAIIPGSDIATGFTFAVTVTNPASFESFTNLEQTGTLISNSGVVTTLNPVPLLLGLNPTSAPARGTGFAATANGLNFVSPSPSGPGSRMRWNGADRNTNYISNVQLTSPVSPADIPPEGTASVAVSNPGPGGGNSNSITFTVTNNRAPLTTLFYPRLVSTAGNESSPDEVTGIAVANLSSVEATLTVTAFDKNGEKITGPGITNPASVSVASIEQVPLVDTDLLGSGVRSASVVGWIKVESTVQEVVGFFLNFNDRLSFLDGADVSSANLKSFILPEIEDQGFTQIHVANPDPAPATLTFELYKFDGTLRTPAVEREVKANGSMAEFFTDLFRGVTREGSDYIRATSNRGVVPFEYLGKTAQYVYGLNGQDATGGGRILYSPQYVVGGRDYRSTLSIVNLDSIAGQVMFEFIGGDGMPIGVTRVVPIAPRGKIYITDQNFFLDPTTHTEGYVKITSTGPKLAGSVVFGDPGRSQFSSTLPLVSTPHSEVVFSQVASDDTYFTGVAILNPTNSVANTMIEVFDARGTLVATTDMSIPPAQRISKVLTEYFPNNLLIENQRSGYIRVKSDTDVASFSLFGTRNQSVLSAVPPQVLPR